ncbi:HPP family protein [Streptomyces sp. NPDC058067]|uniref:HPP family protein n=1 Tax=Streptomyces sp. NPDC058067 TaxID=3346324 RepID=UPI0036E7563B
MLETARRRDGGAGGIAPRSIGGDILAAFIGVAIAAVLIPEATVVAALTVAVTGAGLVGMGYNAVRKKDSAEKMGTVAAIVSKIGDEVRRDGFQGVLKCVALIGKNISEEEVDVIRRKENWDKLYPWIGVHIQVYKVVEHMTDPEKQNSVRHVFWQCMLTKRLGKDFATEMGNAHERGRPGSDADNKADERNNEIGQQLAEDVASESDCLKRTLELWDANKLAKRPDYESDPT